MTVYVYPPERAAAWPHNAWTIADRSGWLPGLYDSEETARAAGKLDVLLIAHLSELICSRTGEGRAITMKDLEKL